MIPKGCKRLAEVDFPIAEVSQHAAREKSIRHGHPSTLHLWWARRPLASSRAVLLALLWPDPCDPLCPEEFKTHARKLLPQAAACNPGTTDQSLRQALLKFIADFANWDLASNRTYLDVSRALVRAAHGEEPPLVVDPFAGGGSIPLEALRLGCEAFASDLNPVACLILKVMLEDIPRHGPKLAEELRRVGAEIKRQAENELADLYPKDPDGATPIAYLWARTVRCESPNCDAEIPLMRSHWLCNKANRKRALRHRIARPAGVPAKVEFEIIEPAAEKDVAGGTVNQAKATCLACGAVLPPGRVRAQLTGQRGGADVIFDDKGCRTGGARILAVVTLKPGEQGRHYRLPKKHDYAVIRKAQDSIARILGNWERAGKQGLSPVPNEPISLDEIRRISVPIYGMVRWGDLFTARQKASLVTLTRLASDKSVRKEISGALSLAISRCTEQSSSLVRWRSTVEAVAGTFGRQALPMMWDFVEIVPTGDLGSNFAAAVEWVCEVIERWCGSIVGQVQSADAANHPLPHQTASVWFTDPPYYDAVPYAHLSDFFYVWLRRIIIVEVFPGFRGSVTPKDSEIVVDRPHSLSRSAKDSASYELGMSRAFAAGQRILQDDGIGCVVFAHKTTEGWEALLTGMIRGGWTITGSWPIATERRSRLNARETAALATSVHLICRPRPEDTGVGDWANVLRELPNRVGDWMERLQSEGVRGADLVFACIGPALEIFSRYAAVETADGREVGLPEYLEKVWEIVGRSALAQVLGAAEARARNGAAGAVEEDARLTALFLWTLQSTNGGGGADVSDGEEEEPVEDEDDEETSRGKPKGFTLVFDVVRRFAQPLGIDLPKWEDRVIETKKGVVRLLPIAERAKQLFGADGAQAIAARLEREAALGSTPLQGLLFPELEVVPKVRGSQGGGKRVSIVSDDSLSTAIEATTLDRVHAAMLLQAGGRTNALRALLKTEQDRGPEFLRLANALSALYPKGSEEKRLLDAMLLAAPR
jgi:adenine-specific DNA methylase